MSHRLVEPLRDANGNPIVCGVSPAGSQPFPDAPDPIHADILRAVEAVTDIQEPANEDGEWSSDYAE